MYIMMLVLISDSRLKLIKRQQDLSQQNFIESILIIFNNYSIDMENLQLKLDQISKKLFEEYIESLQNYQIKDVKILVKARCHLNKKMSQAAGFML